MNSTPSSHDHERPDELPDDLLPLARSLRALGSAEADASPLGIEDRVWAASRAAILAAPADVAAVSSHLDALAVAEGAAAPPGLEPTAFELSREAIAGGLPRAATPALRIVGPARGQAATPTVIVTDRFRLLRRFSALAAVLTLAGIGVGVFLSARPGPSPSSDALAERLDNELSSLFEAVEFARRDQAPSPGHGTEFDLDQSWLETIFSEESL